MIVDSVGSVPITVRAGACDSAQPALNETVKDLLVLVHVRQIRDTVPGQAILGESGPCVVRKPGNLPIVGVMSLNSGTLASLDSSGMLDDVIKHEMAHLLGFGTVWDLDNLLRDTTTKDPWFSGPDAQAAFRTALPSFTDKVVPVEANGGSGTTLSHWRESVMTNELMTGFLNSGANPTPAEEIPHARPNRSLPLPPPGPACHLPPHLRRPAVRPLSRAERHLVDATGDHGAAAGESRPGSHICAR